MVEEVAVSHVPVQSKAVRWRVEGVPSLSQKRGEYIDSGQLMELHQSGRFSASFSLRFYWGGNEKSNDYGSHVSLEIDCIRSSSKKLMWQPQVRMVHQGGGVDEVWQSSVSCVVDCDLVGFNNAEARSELVKKGLMKDDTIIFQLQVKAWVPEVQTSRIPKALPNSPDTTAALVTDFAALLASGEGSDVSLKAGKSDSDGTEPQALRAHRVILATRSSVFQRMFFGAARMAEAMAEAEVCLSDMEPQVAEYFLQFLYTGRVKDEVWKDDDAVCHLLSAGHKYEVTSLVEACVAHLVSSLSEDNVTDRLMLADLLSINQIREAALEYMCALPTRLSKIQSTEAFARLGEKRPRLALQIVSKMVPPMTRKRQAKPELPENLAEKTVAQLKQLCSDCGIPTTGNKQALIERLQNHARS